MSKGDRSGGILWFVAGAAVGVGIAVLYAPKSGKATRQYISDTTGKSKEAVTVSGKELVDRGKDLYDRGRSLAAEAAELFERGTKLIKGRPYPNFRTSPISISSSRLTARPCLPRR